MIDMNGPDIRTLKARFIPHKFSTGWAVDAVKSVEKKKSVAGQFAVKISHQRTAGLKNETRKITGSTRNFLLFERVNTVENNKYRCVDLTHLAG
jgi:hypothetical protein